MFGFVFKTRFKIFLCIPDVHASCLYVIHVLMSRYNIWQRKLHFMDLFAIFWTNGHCCQTIFRNEGQIFRFTCKVIFRTSYLRNEFGDPLFLHSQVTVNFHCQFSLVILCSRDFERDAQRDCCHHSLRTGL